jgi:hypothetical protein
MISRSIYRYYWFGTCLRYLQDGPTGHMMRTGDRGGVRDNIDAFFRYLSELDLVVTQRVSAELEAFAKKLPAEDAATSTAEQGRELTRIVSGIRKTLEAELHGFEAFIVTRRAEIAGRYLFTPGTQRIRQVADDCSV